MRTLEAGRAPGAPSALRSRSLLYITPHSFMPVDDLARMVKEVEEKRPGDGFRSSLYWLSWLDLSPHVERALEKDISAVDRRALQRLLAVLDARRLRSFGGVVPPHPHFVPWRYTPVRFNWGVVAKRVAWRYGGADDRVG